MSKSWQRKKCTAVNKSGAPCNAWAYREGDLCASHRSFGSYYVPPDKPKGTDGDRPKPQRDERGRLLPGHHMGAPAIGEDVWARVLIGLRAGLSYVAATREAGTAYKTFTEKRKADPMFAEAAASAFEEGTARFEDKMYELADTGHYNALIATLKARSPERWSDKLQVEQTTTVEIDPQNRIGSIVAIMAKLQERSALYGGDYIDVKALEPGEE